jgi:hypothetical protein
MKTYELQSPYFVLHDGLHDLEQAAVLAGQLKSAHEELRLLIDSFSSLTSVNAVYQEDRARKLLEILIATKRSYVATETKQLIEKSYEQ